MNYDVFVQKCIEYDKRNKFTKRDLDDISAGIPTLYSKYDPVDVEIEFNGCALTFVPYSKLAKMLKEYSYLNAESVFATSNGDPFFIKKGVVYTCAHGDRGPGHEKVANSFDTFIKMLF